MAELADHAPVTVNGCEIPFAAIAAEAQNHPAPDAPAAWRAAAEALVIRHLLLAEADRRGIVAGELRDDEGRVLTEDDARIEALLAAEVRTPEADEATARRYYDLHRARFVSPAMVEAEHILFAAAPDDNLAYSLATGDARLAIRRLQAEPGAFADLARQYSGCPSKEQGGHLGQVVQGQMVREFEAALFSLDEGCLHPEPVRTRFGVHVIRAGRKQKGRELPFEMVRDHIAQYLEEASWRRAVAQYLAILAADATIEGVTIAAAEGPLVQ